jgi:N-acetylmuramoyl-L-alanine amidase
MKNILLTIFLLAILIVPVSALDMVRVEYNEIVDEDFIKITVIDDILYFNILELNKTLNAFISFDVFDRRIFLDIYDQRLILLTDSSYLLFQTELYSFVYNILYYQGKYYVPIVFLEKLLPQLFPEKISYDSETHTLHAESPVDNTFHTIVIDPGHGGKDPGAIGFSGRVYEKDIVLSVAHKIKQLVEENLDVKVMLTREDDRFIPLQQRTAFANRHQANLFISLHCNAAPNRSASGVEVFFLSVARTDDARAVEMMENAVVEKYEGGEEAVKRYDDLTYILMDMAQAEQLKESSYLAIKLQANLVRVTGANDRGVKQAGFYVLRGAFMPSVLVEFGFISNREEERKLNNSAHQKLLAEAIYEGIKSFIHNYEMFR